MATPKKSPAKKPQPKPLNVNSNVRPANGARGEVAMEVEVNGVIKHCLFVPSFENIARIEEQMDEGIFRVVHRLSQLDVRLRDIVTVLFCLNEGDQVTPNELYYWVVSQKPEELGKKLMPIYTGLVDPQGNRFKEKKVEEAQDDPN